MTLDTPGEPDNVNAPDVGDGGKVEEKIEVNGEYYTKHQIAEQMGFARDIIVDYTTKDDEGNLKWDYDKIASENPDKPKETIMEEKPKETPSLPKSPEATKTPAGFDQDAFLNQVVEKVKETLTPDINRLNQKVAGREIAEWDASLTEAYDDFEGLRGDIANLVKQKGFAVNTMEDLEDVYHLVKARKNRTDHPGSGARAGGRSSARSKNTAKDKADDVRQGILSSGTTEGNESAVQTLFGKSSLAPLED